MSMKLQLQVGKRYVDRQGAISGPLTNDGTLTFPFRCPLTRSIYTASGAYIYGADKHELDLISEYTEPQVDAASKSFADQVDDVLAMVGTMLKAKNKAYGNSALDPVRVFSKADPVEQLNVRIDDKLSRIMRGTDSGEDVDLDLIGYLVIRRIAKGGVL